MELFVDLQIATESDENLPSLEKMESWVETAIKVVSIDLMDEAELTVRIVDIDESNELNLQYRNKDKPTNVLSFPFQNPPGITLPLLGDLVICKTVVEIEAAAQNKSLESHWAHMIVHGTLHLLGFDHLVEREAVAMETLETKILNELGIPDPYLIEKE